MAGFWRQWGVDLLDADAIGHRLIAAGGAKVSAVVQEWGEDFLEASGGINRQKLGALVFADAAARDTLNAILHPEIQSEVHRWADDIRASGRAGAVMIPLLFETGMSAGWDAIVCVASDEPVVLERLRGRGLSEQEARLRMASQWPAAQKMQHADYVILNNDGLVELEKQSRIIYQQVFKQGDN